MVAVGPDGLIHWREAPELTQGSLYRKGNEMDLVNDSCRQLLILRIAPLGKYAEGIVETRPGDLEFHFRGSSGVHSGKGVGGTLADHLTVGLGQKLVRVYDHTLEEEIHLYALQLGHRLVQTGRNVRDELLPRNYLVGQPRPLVLVRADGEGLTPGIQFLDKEVQGIPETPYLRHLVHIAPGILVFRHIPGHGSPVVEVLPVVGRLQGQNLSQSGGVAHFASYWSTVIFEDIYADAVCGALAVRSEYGIASVGTVYIQKVVVRRREGEAEVLRRSPVAGGLVPAGDVEVIAACTV